MEIDCGICSLRHWRVGDERCLVLHANDREIWLNLRDRFPHPFTLADAETWVQMACSQQPQTRFAIDVGGEAVGGIGFELHHDVERLSAELGYWLGRAFWGRRIMSAAVPAATKYAFAAFGLTRVYALAYAHNQALIRVLEKAGYTRVSRHKRTDEQSPTKEVGRLLRSVASGRP